MPESSTAEAVEAIAAMQALLEKEPDYSWGSSELAGWLARRGDVEKLRDLARTWSRHAPRSTIALGYLGKAERQLKNEKAAMEAYGRALALDPDILFFDEPSAGLDPISSRNMDELMLQLRDSLGATFVVVTHELASIFTIADHSVFLDADTRTMRAQGNPRELLKNSSDPAVREFLKRGDASARHSTVQANNPPVL